MPKKNHVPSTEYEWGDERAWEFTATVDPWDFTRTIDPVSSLVDECKLQINEDRVFVRALDPAQVAMVEVEEECVTEADGYAEVGIQIHNAPDDYPGYYKNQSEYKLVIEHGMEESTFAVNNGAEGSHETQAFPPDSVREAEWPDVEGGFEHTFEAPTPHVRGVFLAMAEAARDMGAHIIRVKPQNGAVEVAVFDKGEQEAIESWKILNVDVTAGGRVYYSADYLRYLMENFWAEGTTTVKFGTPQPIVFQNESLRCVQAPRFTEQVEGEN